MNPNLTEILFILDRSGSMASLTEAAISGFNNFLREQAAEPGQARLTLVLFDDRYEVPVAALPLPEITPIDTTVYTARGSTALLDAMGRGIDELGQRLGALPEDQRPGTVIVAVFTDGEENASTRHSWADVNQRIRHQSEKYQWHFLFLGANQDAIATAARVGIHAANSATYLADDHGLGASGASVSRKAKAMRKFQSQQALDAAEQADLNAPLSDIVREEDHKRRE
jgi:uncharacterized protein YegL